MLKSEKCNNFEDLKIISRENYSDQRGEFLSLSDSPITGKGH